MKKRENKFFLLIRKNKTISLIVIAAVLGILIFAGFKGYLYVKFLLGNDIIVRLESDKKDLFLENGQTDTVNFKIESISSYFCSMKCSAVFEDLSRNLVLSQEEFTVGANQEKTKLFNIMARGENTGQEIYQYKVRCKNIRSFFCETKEEPMQRTILLTLNRGLNTQQKIEKDYLKKKLEKNVVELLEKNESLKSIDENLKNLGAVYDVNDSFAQSKNIKIVVKESFEELGTAENFWNEQKYLLLRSRANDFEGKVKIIKENFEELNETTLENIYFYNSLIDKLESFKNELRNLSEKYYNSSDVVKIERTIKNFNEKIKLFDEERNLTKKKKISDELLKIDLKRFDNLSYPSELLYGANATIFFNLTFITTAENGNLSFRFELRKPKEQCCIFGKCKECCAECKNENYPIIFVHGFAFNYGISAEFSVNIFDDLQNSLDKDEYINAGEIYYSYRRTEINGLLGKNNVPLTFRASYYFDSFNLSDGYLPVQTKSENIDTYTIRLKEIVDEVKYQTGKDKVIIIAHSMGGLVSRRYIQVFGNESVDKLILISVPNKGIEGQIKNYCSYLGNRLECRDMDKDSLFINKLNNRESEKVKTYNIIGTGCNMDGEDGDGIVLSKNEVLQNAEKTFYINGSCEGVELLHGTIMKFDKHPEVYEIIKKILANK